MKYALSLFALFLLVVTFSLIKDGPVVASETGFSSVELGISEVSPRGDVGGKAMPASGASIQLGYSQTGDSGWETASPGILPDDRAVNIRWVSTDGSTSLDSCIFTAGYKAPSGTQSPDGDSQGQSLDRVLSAIGGASTYTIVCTDNHTEPGHGASYTVTDTVDLMHQTECNDDFDNDGDGYIDWDGGPANPAVNENINGRAEINAAAGFTLIGSGGVGDNLFNRQRNADKLCELAGYDSATIDRTGSFSSPGDNTVVNWDGSDWETLPASGNNSWIRELTCSTPETPATPDPGCTDSQDDSEDDNSPDMTLEACNDSGYCVSSGGTLVIDGDDIVTLNWTSRNTDFCDSVGTFTMPGGDTTQGTGVDVDEPEISESVDFIVACGNDGTPEVARGVEVRYPEIQLIPYPRPPIIPSGGMPDNDPATVEPQINQYLPTLCTLTGPNDGERTIQAIIDAGDLNGGTYEVDLNSQGETTYILECQADVDGDGVGDGDPVSDSATFRMLPVIQET